MTLGLIGDFKTLSYMGGGGYCAFAKGSDTRNAAIAAASVGGSWKNYTMLALWHEDYSSS